MNDKKSEFISDELSLFVKEIYRLQELLLSLVADTSVLIYTHSDGARDSIGAAPVRWGGPSASPFQFPLHNSSVNWLEDSTDYVNWLEDRTDYVN